MDEQLSTGRRALQFLGLRDEELSVARRRRRERFAGMLLVGLGVVMLAIVAVAPTSQPWLSIAFGCGFLIVGAATLVRTRER